MPHPGGIRRHTDNAHGLTSGAVQLFARIKAPTLDRCTRRKRRHCLLGIEPSLVTSIRRNFVFHAMASKRLKSVGSEFSMEH